VSPQLTIDARGNAVAVWARSDGNNWIVQAGEYEAGVWRSARSLSGPGRDAVAPDVALDPRGGAVAAWARSNGTNTVVEAVFRRVPKGRWERARTLSLAGGDAITPQAALDAQGNGAVIWSRYTGEAFAAQVSGYDAAGPALRDLEVPRRGTAGTPLRFAVSPLDSWSPVAVTRWTFGDGSAADGEEAEHVYEQPGRYTVRVTSADTLGHRSTSSHTVVIAGAG
jgi:PKD domain